MQVSIKGSVSNEVNSGEVVTITVTHPDETQETIMATTDDNGQFTASVDEFPEPVTARKLTSRPMPSTRLPTVPS